MADSRELREIFLDEGSFRFTDDGELVVSSDRVQDALESAAVRQSDGTVDPSAVSVSVKVEVHF